MKSKLFLFYGSMSAIQELESSDITVRLQPGFTDDEAVNAARELLDETCDWDYDLEVKTKVFEGDDNKAVNAACEQYVDGFAEGRDFEDSDGSGNAQSYTWFLVTGEV